MLKKSQSKEETIKKITQRINQRIKDNKKIRVGFYVVFDSVFPAENIFKEMLNDSIFEPFILVIPDVSRGDNHKWLNINKTMKTLSSKYPNVYNSYNEETNSFEDYCDKVDIIVFANPYDLMTLNIYGVGYNKDHALTIHVPYSYTGQFKYTTNAYRSVEYSSFWKIFVENEKTCKLIQKFKINKSRDNLEVVGYPKMDILEELKTIEKNPEPLVVICPHHTVNKIKGYLYISNFVRLADFYLRLPTLYPNVKFIFRPHPLLFPTLTNTIWGEEKVKSYLEKLTSLPNIEYEDGGDYFLTFQKSWGLINDSGSFLPEYFYLNKPQCFILESKKNVNKQFTKIGKTYLRYTYNAFTEDDILKFIDKNILLQEDPKKEEREAFARNEIMINHPFASKAVIESIKGAFESLS